MNFGQLIEYNMRINFLEKSWTKCREKKREKIERSYSQTLF